MEVIVKVTMFPASKGDSFLISFGPKHILVDCGYASTYRGFIKSALTEIHNRAERIERLIITHIDSDHIAGAIELLSENVVEIEQIWHNSYRHLQFDKIPNICSVTSDDLVVKSILATLSQLNSS